MALETATPNANSRLTLLVVDDHPLFVEGFSSVIGKHLSAATVHVATSGEQALEIARQTDFDLVLLDLNLPGIDGYTTLAKFQEQYPTVPVAVISAKERSEDVRRALEAGALGYLPKSLPMQELVAAIERLLEGELYMPGQKPDAMRGDTRVRAAETVPSPEIEALSARQVDVLKLLCHGKSNKQIAQELSLSEKTVKSHITTLFKTLGVVNRTQAVLVARKSGLTST